MSDPTLPLDDPPSIYTTHLDPGRYRCIMQDGTTVYVSQSKTSLKGMSIDVTKLEVEAKRLRDQIKIAEETAVLES